MSPRGGAASKCGVVRTMCLFLIGVALVVLMVGTFSDRSQTQLCINPPGEQDRGGGGGGGGGGAEDVVRKESLLPQTKNQSRSGVDTLVPWDYNWDHKAPSGQNTDTRNVPDRTLILVRHGQYVFETGKLTLLGREQAEMTGRRLKEMNLTYSSIVHSTLDRAAETAQIIHGHVPHVALGMDDLLREGGPIPPNPTITYWGLPERDYFVDGPRLESAFRKYVYRPTEPEQRSHTFDILVGHGNIFRFFALRALQFPRDAWMRVFIAHASITMLHMRADGTVTMSKFGDAGHFPSNKVTY